ncbi:dTDP-4-dehydrorhamnose reductase [Paenisporosarcina indica]|uniref:dTDP-4-dehydrorhamnose reductase n=1 Tax=Paenisporosarcina indica TaxID=650093 RepID=UPI00094FC132|nr:dTDP-4-dehydrorhamnose reductase [Paenisporosarcina indica]
MRVLVTGYSGQLGYDVVKEGKSRNYDMYGTSSSDLDITDKQKVHTYVETLNPTVIIHCAAYTAVDQAEDDQEMCYNVNVIGTKNIAQVAKKIGAKLVYISTDYVFDGQGTEPFTEMSVPQPVGYYGKTKLEGEQVLQLILDAWFIVRVSWVFGINGHNFIKTMLRLSETHDTVNVVHDQMGSPTYTADLSRLILDMIETENYGLYHASNEGVCSWSEFAEEIFKQAGKQVIVNSITTEEYPTRAIRPKNSKMSKQKLRECGFNVLPSWQDAVGRYLAELKQEVEV